MGYTDALCVLSNHDIRFATARGFASHAVDNGSLIRHASLAIPLILVMSSCAPTPPAMPPVARDVHSYGNPNEARVRHVSLDLSIIFEQHTLRGTAVLTIEHPNPAVKQIVLDSRALQVDMVEISPDNSSWKEARFALGKADQFLGAPLAIELEPETRFIRLKYSTAPTASALQWLEPSQTKGGKLPFLYTQSEAIHARSWIPLQDSPGVRVTYDARIHVPPGLTAVMSAANCTAAGDGAEPLPGHASDCHFILDEAVPPYLIALAAGDLKFMPTGTRTGVWAEPAVLEAAATEFSDMERMLQAAEKLYGPYRWERYDVLVLPPSFPYGGMENPRLTFATPTVIAGDKSLVSLVAHELAHSWSGNLVTNATWSDFWLNEGFTVYIERRILEELYGPRRAAMEAELGYQDLLQELAKLPPGDQVLQLNLAGRDPDAGVSSVAYEKGALLLRALEEMYGRPQLDEYLKSYFDHFAFQSITTPTAIEWMKQHLLATDPTLGASVPRTPLQLDEWLTKPGLPVSAPAPNKAVFADIDRDVTAWLAGSRITTTAWSTQEWIHFLRGLPAKLDSAQLSRLDSEFRFTQSHNDEILQEWLLIAIRNHYEAASARLVEFLTTVGRRKYVKPLYEALDARTAAAIYEKARPRYHHITQSSIDAILAAKQNDRLAKKTQ